jgi:hypothetical protein
MLGQLSATGNFQVFGFFTFFSNFFRSNLFIFEPKEEKYLWVFFPLIICHCFQFWRKKNNERMK